MGLFWVVFWMEFVAENGGGLGLFLGLFGDCFSASSSADLLLFSAAFWPGFRGVFGRFMAGLFCVWKGWFEVNFETDFAEFLVVTTWSSWAENGA